ncbi:MAG TPA: MFS transporter [Bacillota bacterium]|nr:MFS transporter [Bacillota bacterium]
MLLIFVLNELTVENPLLDLSILKIWPFSLSILISGLTGIALFGGVFILPLFMQNLQGYTAMQAGILMLPGALASGLTMPISGKLFDRFGAKPVVIPGLAILAATTYSLAHLSLGTSSTTLMMLIGLRGLGLGLCMMPATTAGMNAVPPQLVAGASALSNTVRQVFNSMGLAMLTTFMQHDITLNYSKIAGEVSWFNPGSLNLLKTLQGVFTASGMGSSTAQGAAVISMSGLVQKEAMLQGINDTLLLTAILATLTLPLAFMIKGKYKPHKA